MTREVSARALCRVEGYGFEEGAWRAEAFEETSGGARFRLLHEERPFATIEIGLLGRHNVRNAMAVAAAAHGVHDDRGLRVPGVGEGRERSASVGRGRGAGTARQCKARQASSAIPGRKYSSRLRISAARVRICSSLRPEGEAIRSYPIAPGGTPAPDSTCSARCSRSKASLRQRMSK